MVTTLAKQTTGLAAHCTYVGIRRSTTLAITLTKQTRPGSTLHVHQVGFVRTHCCRVPVHRFEHGCLSATTSSGPLSIVQCMQPVLSHIGTSYERTWHTKGQMQVYAASGLCTQMCGTLKKLTYLPRGGYLAGRSSTGSFPSSHPHLHIRLSPSHTHTPTHTLAHTSSPAHHGFAHIADKGKQSVAVPQPETALVDRAKQLLSLVTACAACGAPSSHRCLCSLPTVCPVSCTVSMCTYASLPKNLSGRTRLLCPSKPSQPPCCVHNAMHGSACTVLSNRRTWDGTLIMHHAGQSLRSRFTVGAKQPRQKERNKHM